MKKTLIIFALIAFMLPFTPLPAEKPEGETGELELTIDKAVQLALENNKNYLVSKEEVKQYKHRLRQQLGFLPSVTLQGTRNVDEKLMEIEIPPFYPGAPTQKTTLDFTRKYEFTLQVVQPLFSGGKIWHNFKNAQLDLEIAKEKHKDAGKAITLMVKQVFFNILVMQELLKAHREALELAETNLHNVEERFHLGMASQYDRLRAELAAAAVKPDLLRVEKQLNLSLFNLKIITGIPEHTPLKIKGELNYTQHHPEEIEFIRQALINASEIVQMKMQMKKADNLLKIAYGQFLPDISLVAAYSYRADAFTFLEKNWENYYTINLAFRFPIFTGLKRSAEVGEIKVIRKILGLNFQQLNDAVKLQIKDLCMTLEQEYENIRVGLKNIETAKEGVRIARLNYDEGLVTILELNSSISELTRARVRFLQAVYNYNIAAAELEKISGVTIDH